MKKHWYLYLFIFVLSSSSSSFFPSFLFSYFDKNLCNWILFAISKWLDVTLPSVCFESAYAPYFCYLLIQVKPLIKHISDHETWNALLCFLKILTISLGIIMSFTAALLAKFIGRLLALRRIQKGLIYDHPLFWIPKDSNHMDM